MERGVDASRLPARLAAAPISWGVCEVPGWGRQLAPERVLAEMADLGITATELGPQGWLPLDGARARAELDRYELRLVGGFVPVVVHEPGLAATRTDAARAAAQLAAAGAEVFVAALVADAAWSAPPHLDDAAWERAGERLRELADLVAPEGVDLVLHPHVGTLVETAEQVDRALAHTDVPWCFDSGHLLIGGVDPVALVVKHTDRVRHTHLKDVDATWAARVQSGSVSYTDAVRQGMYRPLGAGDIDIATIVGTLEQAGYDGWYVLEQDTILPERPTGEGPVVDVRTSIAHLREIAGRV